MSGKRVMLLVQIALAVGLLALLWRLADGAEAARRLASAHPGWLMAAFVALTLQTVLSALRWRLTAGQLGIALDRPTAVREYYLSQLINQALPGGVLGDAARAVRSRAAAGLLASGQAVAFERLAGQIGLYGVFAAAVLASLAAPGVAWPCWLWPPLLALILGLPLVTLALFAIVRLLPGRVGRALHAFAGAAAHALAAPAVVWRQIGLSLATALCNVLAFAFCAFAVGADLSLLAALTVVPMILFAMVVPLTVSGWGVREGAAAALFPLAGASAAEGLAASVAFGLIFLAAVLPALVTMLRAPRQIGRAAARPLPSRRD
ncbi:MAG: lysylphosphatidylglycerol synthase transmembrane domain-containing protein [Pseudomonadota bacterium]